MKAFLDTHAAVALASGEIEAFGRRSADLLERASLFVSPFVRLELCFLDEIRRLDDDPDAVIASLATTYGVMVSMDSVHAVVAEAMTLHWTRDPFDRLLVATAKLHRAPFISRDSHIHDHYADAVW